MRFYEKGLFLKLGLLFSLIHLLVYAPVHLAFQDFMLDAPVWVQVALGVLVSLASEVVGFVLPLLAASVIFISYAYRGLKHALLKVPMLALPYIISALPENYLRYLAYFDSVGAIFFASVFTILTLITVTVEILVLFGVIAFFYRFPKDGRFDKKVLAPLEENCAFDFQNRFAKGALMASLLALAVRLGTEIFSTVSFLRQARGFYQTEEIITIAATYIFIALMWVASYSLMYNSKVRIIAYRLDESE